MKNLTVNQIDKHLEFLQNEAKRLTSMGQRWADIRAEHYTPIIEILRQIRQDKQMRGLNDAPIVEYPPIKSAAHAGSAGGTGSSARPDQAALDAAPELVGKKALVLYFETQQDVEDFIDLYQQVHPKVRTVQL